MKTGALDIVGSTKFDRYTKQSTEATYNMIISDGALVPFAGYERKMTVLAGADGGREIYTSTSFNHMITVFQDQVYIIDNNLGRSFIGSLHTASGLVSIAENNAGQIALVDGLNVYIYNIKTGTFTTVEVEFSPVFITFQDTYFIVATAPNENFSSEFRLSEGNNGLSWPESLVASLQTKPDVLVATIAFERQLFVIGKNVAEIWHNSPQPGNTFPYQRDNSLSIPYGCISAATIDVGNNLIVWLAFNAQSGPTIVASTGGQVQAITTDGIDFILSQIKTPENSSAFIFEEAGHTFYQITFPGDKITLVYDFSTQKFFNVTNDCLQDHIARRIAFFNNSHYFISSIDGDLYEMGTQFVTYKEDTDIGEIEKEIPRIRITSNFRLPDAGRYTINNLSLTIEQGDTNEPQKLALSMSKDGGYSYGSIMPKILNPMGKRQNKCRFWQLGASNDTVFQFRFWGKFRFVVIGSTITYQESI